MNVTMETFNNESLIDNQKILNFDEVNALDGFYHKVHKESQIETKRQTRIQQQ